MLAEVYSPQPHLSLTSSTRSPPLDRFMLKAINIHMCPIPRRLQPRPRPSIAILDRSLCILAECRLRKTNQTNTPASNSRMHLTTIQKSFNPAARPRWVRSAEYTSFSWQEQAGKRCKLLTQKAPPTPSHYPCRSSLVSASVPVSTRKQKEEGIEASLEIPEVRVYWSPEGLGGWLSYIHDKGNPVVVMPLIHHGKKKP